MHKFWSKLCKLKEIRHWGWWGFENKEYSTKLHCMFGRHIPDHTAVTQSHIPTALKYNLLSSECQFSIRRTEKPSTIHHSSCHLGEPEESPGTQLRSAENKKKKMGLAHSCQSDSTNFQGGPHHGIHVHKQH